MVWRPLQHRLCRRVFRTTRSFRIVDTVRIVLSEVREIASAEKITLLRGLGKTRIITKSQATATSHYLEPCSSQCVHCVLVWLASSESESEH
jgi:hypothetical protein